MRRDCIYTRGFFWCIQLFIVSLTVFHYKSVRDVKESEYKHNETPDGGWKFRNMSSAVYETIKKMCGGCVRGWTVSHVHSTAKSFVSEYKNYFVNWGRRWRSWLRQCATCRKVTGSIPGCAIGVSLWHNPSGRTLVLGSTQPLTEMSTRNTSWWGKGGRCLGLTTLPHSCAYCLEILEASTSWNSEGLLKPVQGWFYLYTL
jgi:hypothetical protein